MPDTAAPSKPFDSPSVSVVSTPARSASSRLTLSELAPGVMQSEIRAMTTECDRMGGINLAQGVCDTPVPAPVEEEAIKAIRAGYNIYTRLDGIERLRKAIAEKQQRDYGLTLRSGNRSPGGQRRYGRSARRGHGAAQSRRRGAAVRAVLRLPRGHAQLHARQAGAGRAGRAGLGARHGCASGRDHADAPGPSSSTRRPIPAGRCFRVAEIEAIADACREHDLFLFTDEIYEYFVYDGARHISPATLPGMRERTIVMSGFSENVQYHRMAPGLCHRRCQVDGCDGLFPRPDVRVRALGFPAWGGGGPGAASGEFLYPDRHRPPVEAGENALGPARCGIRAQRACRSLLRSGQRRSVCRAKRRHRRLATCWPRPAWHPWREARSSAPDAARTCCASASPSRTMNWMKPARGCASCESWDPSRYGLIKSAWRLRFKMVPDRG